MCLRSSVFLCTPEEIPSSVKSPLVFDSYETLKLFMSMIYSFLHFYRLITIFVKYKYNYNTFMMYFQFDKNLDRVNLMGVHYVSTKWFL